MTFYIANKPFQTMKTLVSKTHKVGIFPKGLVHGLGKKYEILLTFRLCKIHLEKVFDDVLLTKQAFLDNTSMHFKKKEKLAFFQRG